MKVLLVKIDLELNVGDSQKERTRGNWNLGLDHAKSVDYVISVPKGAKNPTVDDCLEILKVFEAKPFFDYNQCPDAPKFKDAEYCHKSNRVYFTGYFKNISDLRLTKDQLVELNNNIEAFSHQQRGVKRYVIL